MRQRATPERVSGAGFPFFNLYRLHVILRSTEIDFRCEPGPARLPLGCIAMTVFHGLIRRISSSSARLANSGRRHPRIANVECRSAALLSQPVVLLLTLSPERWVAGYIPETDSAPDAESSMRGSKAIHPPMRWSRHGPSGVFGSAQFIKAQFVRRILRPRCNPACWLLRWWHSCFVAESCSPGASGVAVAHGCLRTMLWPYAYIGQTKRSRLFYW